MPREGSLSDIGFCEILATLCRDRETGVLRLSGQTAERSVYLQSGGIIFASSRDPDDRLGELLLTRGVITRQQLEEAARQLGPGKRMGAVLVEMGILPVADLPRWVREQVKEILFSLFSWTDGTYHFKAGPFPSSEAITLRLSTAEIFLSGLRQVQKWSVLRKGAGEIRIPYRLSAASLEALREIALGEEEKRLLALLQSNPVTMEQAALESGLSTLRVYQLFFAFRVLGVIVPDETPAPLPKIQDHQEPLPDDSATVRFIPPKAASPVAARMGDVAAVPDKPASVPPHAARVAREADLDTGTARRLIPEALPSAPRQASPGVQVGAQTVMLRASDIKVSMGQQELEVPIAELQPEPVAPPATTLSDAAISGKPALEEGEKGVDGNSSSTSAPTTPGKPDSVPAQGLASGKVPSPAASSSKRSRADYRVVRLEGSKLDGNGAQKIEELLRQWAAKGYHLAGVAPGGKAGLFASGGDSYFIFTRENPS